MRWRIVALLLCGCGNAAAPTDGGPPAGSGDPNGASTVQATVAAPASLVRTTTPAARHERDEKACEGGELAACRKAADRYRGYGHGAGCGVPRTRRQPTRMVTAADSKDDALGFDRWIRRACDLGDEEACLQGKNHVASQKVSLRDADACSRGKLEECPLYLWQAGMSAEAGKKIAAKRLEYLKSGVSSGLFTDLYRREKKKVETPDALPREAFELAERVCKATLECDEPMMMLDRAGYTPTGLAPLAKSMGETLVAACLAGDCVCGRAASYLDEGDPRALDLARMGCEDGEPDACWLLGRATEASDARNALALYDVACPSIVGDDGRPEIWSKRACDRLSELSEEGKLMAKDSDRAFYYSSLACTQSGLERHHAPCVRRALFHVRQYRGVSIWFPMTTGAIANEVFFGSNVAPGDGKECERPSVRELCKANEAAVLKVKARE